MRACLAVILLRRILTTLHREVTRGDPMRTLAAGYLIMLLANH